MKSSTSDPAVLLDSNVLIAFFRKEEDTHKAAVAFLNSLENFLISEHVLSEVMTVLQLREGPERMKKAVDLLVHNKAIGILRLSWEELSETIAFMQVASKEISFVDCSLLVLAHSRNLRVGTFDKAMIAAGKEFELRDLNEQ